MAFDKRALGRGISELVEQVAQTVRSQRCAVVPGAVFPFFHICPKQCSVVDQSNIPVQRVMRCCCRKFGTTRLTYDDSLSCGC